VRRDAFDLHENGLDLRREDVDPPDDQHVVGAPPDALHANVRPAARARLVVQRGDIACAIPDKGHALLAQGVDFQI